MRRLHPALLALAALLVAVPSASAFDLQPIGSFRHPVYAVGPPGDGSRLLVLEKEGRIRLVKDGVVRDEPFLDLRSIVYDENEAGLLSLAFAADYAQSGRFYVAYVVNDGSGPEIVVAALERDSPDVGDPDSSVEILRIDHPGPQHFSGQLQLGRDGFLWMSTGDGGGPYDPAGNAQDLGSLLGKILRIDPKPGGGYDIPPGNPFAGGGGGGGAPEIWASGLRNPWRFSFDRGGSGDLFIADVGETHVEELDRAEAPGLGKGANYGWRAVEGDYETGFGTPPAGAVAPLITHTHDSGWNAITGGYVIRDPSLAEAGKYVYGDFVNRQIRLADPATGATTLTDEGISQLTSFGEDGLGRVYAMSLTGPVYRLVAEGTDPGGQTPIPTSGEGTDPFAAGGQTPIPSSGDGGTDPSGRGTDPSGPRVFAATARRQRALRRGRVFVRAGCDVDCTLALGGTLDVGARSFRLPGRRAKVRAGARRRLAARVGPRAARAARRSLRRGVPVRAKLTLRGIAADGTQARKSITVEVRP
ncbi:MAG TPA: PQQ-dependent sugar dehydrogenase [Solirubrobacteraceae bacterium]